jgi:hypothetical protein
MRTDELIEALARAPEVASNAPFQRRLMIALALGSLLALGLLQLIFGLRPDIGPALPAVAAKAAFSSLIAIAAGAAALKLAKPGARGQPLMIAGVVMAAGFAIAAVSLFGAQPGARLAMWLGGGLPWCVIAIPALATPLAALLVWAWREAAPTRLTLAGAAIGAFSGGVGAVVYALYCPVDSVAFVATWYGVGIGLAAGLGALLGRRLLRW